MPENDTEMLMLFSFPDQSQSFTLGFEAGKIWEAMDGTGELVIDRGFSEGLPIRADNLLLMQRMAAVRNYTLETGEAKDGWVGIRLTYTPNPKPVMKLVPPVERGEHLPASKEIG